MNKRLKIIFDNIIKVKTFVDVGCDHGYIAREMLVNNKCEKVIISDISESCLKKANKLLVNFIKIGKAKSILSNGFDNFFDGNTPLCVDCALIAGMGGVEIVSILKNAIDKNYPLPNYLCLQPMKNCEKVRVFCVENGYKIDKDFVFVSSKKYYDLIVLSKGKDKLNSEEIKYGRDNIVGKNKAFIDRLIERKKTLQMALNTDTISENSKNKILDEIMEIDKYVIVK